MRKLIVLFAFGVILTACGGVESQQSYYSSNSETAKVSAPVESIEDKAFDMIENGMYFEAQEAIEASGEQDNKVISTLSSVIALHPNFTKLSLDDYQEEYLKVHANVIELYDNDYIDSNEFSLLTQKLSDFFESKANREIENMQKESGYYAAEIGMTAEKVLESKSWGKPVDINRTTTANGVSEQWVYSGDRYIYLEDGIVTAIQE